ARPAGRQHYFRNRRRGRTFARIAAQGKADDGVRLRDLAPSNGPHHASGTDLSGRDHLVGSPLSPRLTRACASGKRAPTLRCSKRGTSIRNWTPSAAAGLLPYV